VIPGPRACSAGRAIGTLARAVAAAGLALGLLSASPATAGRAASQSTQVFLENFPPTNPRQWTLLSLKDGSRTYLAGSSYQIIRAHPGIMRGWPLSIHVPSGMEFSATFKLNSGIDSFEGITFRDDWGDNFDMLAITPGGEAALLRHRVGVWILLVDWRHLAAVHRGVGSVNTLAVNLDKRSASQGRTFLINGVPLGKPCNDPWLRALGNEPRVVGRRLSAGLAAGSFTGSAHAEVIRAGMDNGTALIKADHSVC
jgi:hypothetical protein